jgi:hypothetical protein
MLQPTDLLSLADVAALTGRPLATVRSWPVRNPEDSPHPFPRPWREGRQGEPNLYLREDVTDWLQRTGRL